MNEENRRYCKTFSPPCSVKNKLKNKMGDNLLDDCIVTCIELDVFSVVNEDDIIDIFTINFSRYVLYYVGFFYSKLRLE